MSFAKNKNSTGKGKRAAAPPGRRVTSITRNIAFGLWIRRLIGFAVFDVLLVVVLIAAFVIWCHMQVPTGSFGAGTSVFLGGSWSAIGSMTYVLTLADGSVWSFPVADLLAYAIPICILTFAAEIVSLLWSLGDTRKIRLQLKPLNDLALAAESMGAEAARTRSHTTAEPNRDTLDNLERAIANVSIETPRITTGDQDLRSIEVALNGLLRRMQQAQQQQVQFVSDASHELRTPIAVIQGYVEMLDRWGTTDPAVLQESIEALKGESAHMKQLVEELLFLARGDSGRTMLQPTTFNMSALVSETCEESHMIDPQHEYVCKFGAEAADDPAYMIEADRAMIKQVLRALIQNAARYSVPDTSISFDVRTAGNEICVSIQDEGIGIASDQVSHIFDRFWRSDTARDREAGGTGLGLSIVDWIVNAHAGHIDVVSREGIGTRFTIILPKAYLQQVQTPANPSSKNTC